MQGEAGSADALTAAPAVVLVEAAVDVGIDLGGGSALSVAPLLGAAAAVDAAHPRWLHVHVRPPARGLIKTVRVRPRHALRIPWSWSADTRCD